MTSDDVDVRVSSEAAVLSETFAGNYKLWKGGKLTAVDFMKKVHLPRTTFYRLGKRYESM